MTFAALLRPELSELRAYAPDPVDASASKLDANEAPNLVSRELAAIVREAICGVALERYPDPRALQLKEAISARGGAKVEEIFVGSGSDEVISLLFTALARPRERQPAPVVIAPTPSFPMYRVNSRTHGWKCAEVPLTQTWELEPRTMGMAIETMNPNLVFIASPNNPTGNAMNAEVIEALVVKAKDALVVLDEAYAEYAGKTLRELRAKYTNVAVLRTVSKLGLAALRVGWLEADAALVASLDKARLPFNVSATSQAAAAAVLREGAALLDRVVREVVVERERVAGALAKMARVEVTPSAANFLWLKTAMLADDVRDALAHDGVHVRSFQASGGRLKNQLRVSIGTPADNDRFLAAISKVAA